MNPQPSSPPAGGWQQPSGPQPPRQRRRWPWIVGGVVAVLVVGGLVGRPAGSPNATGVITPTPATLPTAAAPLSPAPAATAAPQAAPSSWTMPNLIGSNLQDAQDEIQALTGNQIFFTRSHDASGAGRHQIVDRDWQVCTQNVKAGAKITPTTKIDFGAVKLSEGC